MQLDNVADIYPLSPAHSGMLYHSIAAPGSGVYVGQINMRLRGPLDPPQLIAAWRAVIERHAALRAAFIWDGVDQPLQVIRRQVELGWELLDWRDRGATEQRAAIVSLMQQQRRASFDPAVAPLMHMTLIRVDEQTSRLIWCFHHLIVDGWSKAIIVDEVWRLYREALDGVPARLPPAPAWRDYIACQQARDRSGDQPFWRQYLQGFTARNSLNGTAAASTDPAESQAVRQRQRRLSATLSTRLSATARQLRITHSTLIHAAWALLLHHYCDQRELVFGSTVSGRPAGLAGVERLVGMCINTLPVRVRIDPQTPLGDWLRQLQTELLGLHEHQLSSLADIQACSELPPGESLFDSIVVFENYPAAAHDDGDQHGLRPDDIEHLDQSNFPLALLAMPGERLTLMLVHRLSRYSRDSAERMLRHLENLLAAIPDGLRRPLGELPMLDKQERRQLDTWNDTATALPSLPPLHQAIAARAAQTPQATALICDQQRLDYAGMERLANQWAHALLAQGVAPGERVAICMQRGVMMVVALLATMKAGATYVPLDPGYPATRLHQQLQDCRPRLALVDADSAALLQHGDTPLLTIGSTAPRQPDSDPGISIAADATAYLLYTSGSSGRPKGVRVSHANLRHATAARDHYYPQPPAVFLLLSSLAFDSSVAGIFWTLASGGTLLISAHRAEQDPQTLLDLIAEHQVSHTLCLPSLYRVLLEHAAGSAQPDKQLASLRTVILAGEPFPADGLLTRHRELLPAAQLYNEYGPTEATVWASVFDTSGHPDGEPVPIGHAITNTRLLLLDSEGRPSPIGLPGEIVIAGPGVATGYLRADDDATAGFVDGATLGLSGRLYRSGDLGRHRPDGAIEFLGRRDQQLKIRGHRIEPAEVAAALRQQPLVDDAVVLALPAQGEQSNADTLSDSDIDQLAWRLLARGEDAAEALLDAIEALPADTAPEQAMTGGTA